MNNGIISNQKISKFKSITETNSILYSSAPYVPTQNWWIIGNNKAWRKGWGRNVHEYVEGKIECLVIFCLHFKVLLNINILPWIKWKGRSQHEKNTWIGNSYLLGAAHCLQQRHFIQGKDRCLHLLSVYTITKWRARLLLNLKLSSAKLLVWIPKCRAVVCSYTCERLKQTLLTHTCNCHWKCSTKWNDLNGNGFLLLGLLWVDMA